MSKLATLYVFILALLLTFSLMHASRPNLAVKLSSLNHGVVADVATKEELDTESCEGVKGIKLQDCLKRTILNAHIDYIYTNDTDTN
ncbi:unnamed protein product [Lupinus luteus]|uniref:Phytosulfokine n=1 Tax=Lupinus luteus TaxID=3873 RepID=A0AAV1XPJ2_LUPLU